MICPHCGREIEPQQRRAAAFRWASLSPAQRSAEMSRIRRKGAAKSKRVARRSNNKLSQSASAKDH